MRFGPALALSLVVAGCDSCDGASVTTPPPLLPGVGIERAFPGLAFERPVFVTAAPGSADRLYVVEQGGVIRTFDPTEPEPTPKVFLDLSAKVSRTGNEEGLLGLAFHPGYAENGRLFVHYSAPGLVSTVSELHVSEDRDRVDPDSEVAILTQKQPYRNHNGGSIAFGPDGMFYIGFGDGGAAGDPEHRAQDLKTWLGKMLRIDVDTPSGSQPWSVPADNPFVGVDGRRPEIWAFGLRNPWRFSFDRLTGALWAGDVGQDRLEEVDIVERGANYGWRVFEGNERFDEGDELGAGSHAKPVTQYGRNEGKSITGGYVYRGKSIPLLQGVYVFGDFVSGRIWGLLPNSSGGLERRLLVETGKQIASFGEDAAGELYACAFDGGIYEIVKNDAEPPNLTPLPKLLSQTQMFANVTTHEPAADVLAYEVNAPLWSDGAEKQRLVRVPAGSSIGFSESGAWTFPEGTTFAKTFSLGNGSEAKRLETRIIRRQQGYWQAASYVWNASQTDASLSPDGATIDGDPALGSSQWQVPTSDDCRGCHTDAAGFILGAETAQLNRDGQIAQWLARGFLGPISADPSSLPALARPDDTAAGLEGRARAYLHANCAHCHRPNGPGNASIDLRWTTPLAETKTVGGEPSQGDLGVAGALIVAPGDPARSTLVLRMATRELGAMPPLATRLVDDAAVDLVGQWITSLEP